jgi:L-ribulose-5-phosphate 3-epimerase UlaE
MACEKQSSKLIKLVEISSFRSFGLGSNGNATTDKRNYVLEKIFHLGTPAFAVR